MSVSDKDDHQEVARLERLNEELSTSLQRCRALLHDYEARLAANSNDAEIPGREEETKKA